MSRKGKYILLLLLAVLFIGPGLFLAFAPTIDLGPYRQQLATKLSQSLQRKLSLEGPLSIKLGLKPVLRLAGLTLANPDWCQADHFIQAGQSELSINLLSLLFGQVEIERLVVHKAAIVLVQQADGRNNWTLDQAEDQGEGRRQDIIVHYMELDDVDIGLRMPTQTRQLHIAHVGLQDDEQGHYSMDLSGTLDGRQLAMQLESDRWPLLFEDEPLNMQFSLRFDNKPLSVRLGLQQLAPQLHAELHVAAESLDLDEILRYIPRSQVAGQVDQKSTPFELAQFDPYLQKVGHVELGMNIKQFRYHAYDVRGLTWQSSLIRATPLPASALVLEAKAELAALSGGDREQEKITAGKLTLALESQGLGAEQLLASVHLKLQGQKVSGKFPKPYTIQSLALGSDRVGALKLESRLDYNKAPLRLSLQTEKRFFEQLLRQGNESLSLRLQAGESSLIARARLADLLRPERRLVDVKLAGKRFSDWAPLLGVDLPEVPQYRMQGQVEWLPHGIGLKGLSIETARSNIEARLFYRFGKRDTLSLLIDKGRLALSDLEQATTPVSQTQPAKQDAATKKLIPEFDLLSFLSPAIDVNVEIKPTSVLFPEITLEGLSAQVQWHEGLFYGQIRQGRVVGGELSGEVYLSNLVDEAAGKANLTLKQLDYGRLLKELGVGDKMQGKADIRLYMVGFGAGLRELVTHADGRLEIVGEKGVLVDKYLRLWSEDIMRQVIPKNWFGEEETRLNCVVGRFDLQDGKLKSDAILVDTERVTVAGTGAIDLANEQLEFVLTPDPKQASLISLATPVKIGGTLSKPELQAHKLGTAWTIGSLLVGLGNPALLLTRFAKVGSLGENPCLAAIGKDEWEGQSSVLKSFKDAIQLFQRPLDKLPDL